MATGYHDGKVTNLSNKFENYFTGYFLQSDVLHDAEHQRKFPGSKYSWFLLKRIRNFDKTRFLSRFGSAGINQAE